jgi:hypothetical protein
MSHALNTNISFAVRATPFPIPAHLTDTFAGLVGDLLGLFLIIAWMWPFSRLVRNIVEEKEGRVKEGLKVMGLSNAVFWLSWATTYLIIMTISCLILTFMLHPTMLFYSGMGLTFLLFFLFSLTTISFGLMVSTLFSRAKTAGTLSMFLLLALFLPFFAVNDPTVELANKTSASLCSPVAFSLGLSQMLQFNSAFLPLTVDDYSTVYRNYTMVRLCCVGH